MTEKKGITEEIIKKNLDKKSLKFKTLKCKSEIYSKSDLEGTVKQWKFKDQISLRKLPALT